MKFSMKTFLGIISIPFLVFVFALTMYALNNVQAVQNYSREVTSNAIPRILSMQKYLINIRALEENFSLLEKNISIKASREHYIEMLNLIAIIEREKRFVQKVDIIGLKGKIDQFFEARKKLYRLDQEVVDITKRAYESYGNIQILKRNIDAFSEIQAITVDTTTTAILNSYSLLSRLDRALFKVDNLCVVTRASSDRIDSICKLNAIRSERFNVLYQNLNKLESELNELKDDITSKIEQIKNNYDTSEVLIIKEEIQRLGEIVSIFIPLIFIIIFSMLGIVIVYAVVMLYYFIRPLKVFASSINLFRQNSAEDIKLPKASRITELETITKFLELLFTDIKDAKHESENLKVNYDKLLLVSQRDELTGAFNRRALTLFKEQVPRLPPQFVVLMLDIDYFKRLNDSLGHQYGDKVLKAVSITLMRNVSSNDMVYRYGGEEFCICLRNITEENAIAVAQRLCDTVRELKLKRSPQEGDTVTISVGVSKINNTTGQFNLDEMISMADKALYYAKEHGRNCVIPYDLLAKKGN